MVDGNPLEEEPMTAVMLPVDAHLLERDDLTVDDLTSLPEDLRYELIDGRLVLTPSAIPLHNLIGLEAAFAIRELCPVEFIPSYEQSMRIGHRTQLVPDVVVLRAEASTRSPLSASDVLLVVEIVSESSKITDRNDKRQRYEQLGIPGYWIIDPLAERVTLTELRLGPDGYDERRQTNELVTLDEPWKITLDLPEWTRRRDHLRAVARP
jgi:Uma2 family endonuclease